MNATEFLKNNHQAIDILFDAFENADHHDEKREVFQKVKDELTLHIQIEEEIFYPLCARHEELQELIERSIDENIEVKDLLEEIESVQNDEDETDFDGEFEELMDVTRHHFEEEESDLFPKLNSIMTDQQLVDIGRQMSDIKDRNHSEAA